MQIVIPAAGIGSRLMPYTNSTPKCLLPIARSNALTRILAQATQFPITEIIIISGHKAECLHSFVANNSFPYSIKIVHNHLYKTTNSIYSIWLSMPFWREEAYVIDSDLLLANSFFERVANTPKSYIVIDSSKPKHEIDMKAEVSEGRVVRLSKSLEPNNTQGEFFGVSRWSAKFCVRFKEAVDKMVSDGREKDWYEEAINVLGGTGGVPFITADSSEWFEFDTPEDLLAAEERSSCFYSSGGLEPV